MAIPPVNNSAATSPASTASAITSGTDKLANEQTFLKLFVAQMKNQDPLSPQDPTQFISQLAQFSQLEQSLQMRQDLDAIVKASTVTSTSKTA